ncbi:MarR family transcriptional regulator [Novosphingobium flavum]|uniref:MarR family transcriptional regulator n=1 Tax=Novosphingobium aerophilum TaxID=2839843 RepID=A0A7X1F5P4_9SPHN|nr:MarR family transcriptional regulator [Novosphingobium aerophilum]MBC2650881.1 MarR family transcriptional regulator [Novosphingobium aerophilum]MBC2661410.1 MarR family transcriptional regulator [Novosphingobium aerophilum]
MTDHAKPLPNPELRDHDPPAADPWPDDPLAALPGYLLRRAANAMMAELATRLTALDLRISEATVLLLLGGREDLTSADIGKALDIQRANMVPLLARLETAGLIRREPINRKSQAILLTEAGQDRLARVREVTDRFERDLLDRVPDAHRAHLVPALRALSG